MSQENVEIVRRYVGALEKAIAAYWSDPRPGVAAMEKGELRPENREVFRYLDPEVEWNTAFAGVSFRGHPPRGPRSRGAVGVERCPLRPSAAFVPLASTVAVVQT